MRAQAQIAVAYGLDSASKPNRLYVTIDGVMAKELDWWYESKVSAMGITHRSDARGVQLRSVVRKPPRDRSGNRRSAGV